MIRCVYKKKVINGVIPYGLRINDDIDLEKVVRCHFMLFRGNNHYLIKWP